MLPNTSNGIVVVYDQANAPIESRLFGLLGVPESEQKKMIRRARDHVMQYYNMDAEQAINHIVSLYSKYEKNRLIVEVIKNLSI